MAATPDPASGQGGSVTPSEARRPGLDQGTAATPAPARRREAGPPHMTPASEVGLVRGTRCHASMVMLYFSSTV